MRLFFLTMIGLFLAANVLAGMALDFILVRLDAPEATRWVLALFFILQVVGMLLMVGARLLGYQPGTGLGRPLLSFLMIWNLLLALPTAVIALIWAGMLLLMGGVAEMASIGRTLGLVGVSLPFLIAIFANAVALRQLNRFRIRHLKLTIPHLPPALKGFRIIHLSDFHIGKLTRGQVLEDIVTATNDLNADLILYAGDLVNLSLEDMPGACAMLRQLKSRHGLFLCEGNHDLIENRLGFERLAKQSGLGFLFNERAAFTVNGHTVQILGLRWTGHVSEVLTQLLAQGKPNDFSILLAHHPDVFDAAAEAGIPLTLAGHTHGGQLMLTEKIGFGPWLYRYWSGLYHKNVSQLVVSNGTGNWFPLRMGAPAEIIHLTLD